MGSNSSSNNGGGGGGQGPGAVSGAMPPGSVPPGTAPGRATCSFTPTLAAHFNENLIKHVQGWPAEHVEKQVESFVSHQRCEIAFIQMFVVSRISLILIVFYLHFLKVS